MTRYDIVIYGASGFTGAQIVKTVATADICKGKTVAVAGRNESKIRATLDEVAKDIGPLGTDVRKYPVLIADTSDPESLDAMAKQAKVIINAVGPYRLYGEPVVKAAIENGASHVDISGEERYIERMELLYKEKAAETGSYVVSACGWDSIPVDMGVEYLKRNFPGELGYAETCCSMMPGEKGLVTNTGTFNSIVMHMAELFKHDDGDMKSELMPKHIPHRKFKPPTRIIPFWRIHKGTLDGWAQPFGGGDKSVVQRSQYYDFLTNNEMPIPIETYFFVPSMLYSILIGMWSAFVFVFAQFGFTRSLLLNHPEFFTLGYFNRNGPTKEQREGIQFKTYIFGKGWKERAGKAEHDSPPDTEAYVIVGGRDPGYEGTSAFVVASAVAVLDDHDKLPPKGGVYTSASAFRRTRIVDYIRSLGITFEMITTDEESHKEK